MLKKLCGLVMLLTFAAALLAQGAAKDSLTVKISGIRNTNGRIWVGLWNSASGFPEGDSTSFRSAWIEGSQVRQSTVSTTFADLPPGEYAIVAMHDENRNDKLDKNFFGVPKEGWGVSNGFFSKTHSPTFNGAKFLLNQPTQVIPITIRY